MIIVKFFCFEFYFAFWQISFYSCKNKLLKPVEICAYVQFNGVDTRTDTRCALLLSLCDFFFWSLEWTLFMSVKFNADCRQLYLLCCYLTWQLFGLFHIALLILLMLLELLEQTALPCDPCLCGSQPTWYCAVISFTDWQTWGQKTVNCLVFSVSPFLPLPPRLGPRASGRCTRLGNWWCFTRCSPPGSTACALVPSACLC